VKNEQVRKASARNFSKNRFEFGENWRSFVSKVGDEQINLAVSKLQELIPNFSFANKSALDIGCGSGIHSLALLKLGCRYVESFDYDPICVQTTQNLLSLYSKDFQGDFHVRKFDVLAENKGEKFDVVYSWGVLHHTGNLDLALRKSTEYVDKDGLFVFALYRKTVFCRFWKIEKYLYCHSPKSIKLLAQSMYIGAFIVRHKLFSISKYKRFLAQYHEQRGMDFYTDVKDWLGGYPYESISPKEVRELMHDIGFEEVLSVTENSLGLFGSGCDEYVYKRIDL